MAFTRNSHTPPLVRYECGDDCGCPLKSRSKTPGHYGEKSTTGGSGKNSAPHVVYLKCDENCPGIDKEKSNLGSNSSDTFSDFLESMASNLQMKNITQRKHKNYMQHSTPQQELHQIPVQPSRTPSDAFSGLHSDASPNNTPARQQTPVVKRHPFKDLNSANQLNHHVNFKTPYSHSKIGAPKIPKARSSLLIEFQSSARTPQGTSRHQGMEDTPTRPRSQIIVTNTSIHVRTPNSNVPNVRISRKF